MDGGACRLQSMGPLRVGHNRATSLSLFTFIGEGNGKPLQCSCLENPRDGGAWWAAVYGVTQSRKRLKRLSRVSNMMPGPPSDPSINLNSKEIILTVSYVQRQAT